MVCTGTYTNHPGDCWTSAKWVIYAEHKDTGGRITAFACAQHLHKVLATLQPDVHFSRETFRVLPAQWFVDFIQRQNAK